jgi:DNA-binding NtrC family response regulator
MAKCILIVDDDPAQQRILEETVKSFGHVSISAESGEQAFECLHGADGTKIDLILLDLVMPGLDGMGVLDRLRNDTSAPPVIVQTSNGSIDTAINAMRAGASDFVVKPVSPERLEVSIKNALRINQLEGEIKRVTRKVSGNLTFGDLIIEGDPMIIEGDPMKRVVDLGRRAAQSNIPVLIEGESGVGKELIARAIQGESERAGKPFVTVNCGAIPENLVESILFGHEKGSFTGASAKRDGKFVEAHGGTLFLDEVGELPLDAQVKLLRALQEGEVDPVGARSPVKVDFRLISATNQDMIKLVNDGRFREDLYYRLNVFPVWVPPLRERTGDVSDLVEHFIRRFASEEGKRIDGISADALEMLKSYPWPGNVRQLENAVFRAIVLADQPILTVNEFPQIAAHVEGFEAMMPAAPAPRDDRPVIDGPAMIGGEAEIPATMPLGRDNGRDELGIPALDPRGDVRTLEDIEADMIRLAIGRYRGQMTEIAKKLGIGRSTLYRKMREFGLHAHPN